MVTLNPNSPVAPDLAREIAEDRLAMAELAADASALSIDTLDLENIRVLGQEPTVDAEGWGRALAAALTAASCTRTIEGASTLVLTFDDPLLDLLDQDARPVRLRALTNSNVFDLRDDGRLDAVAVDLNTLTFRLVKVEKQQDSLVLTFEEEAVALLRQHSRRLAVSRDAMTRAQFVWRKLIREVTQVDIPFCSPEFLEPQAITRATDLTTAGRDARRQHGLPPGLKVAGWDGTTVTLDANQTQNAELALTEADVQQAPERATMALLEACIVEGPMFANPAGGDASSAGILQLLSSHLGGSTSTRGGRRDVALVSRMFLTQGFTGQGGAIQLSRDHPDWLSGDIAQAVQGSAFPERYGKAHQGAATVLQAWRGGATGTAATRTTVERYQFTRGVAGKTETSWDAMQRLASEVNWRCFCVAGVVFFISEDWLFESRSRATISEATPGVDTIDFDWDQGKPVAQVTVHCHASRWSFPPGSVINIENTGPASGRWLVHTIERGDLFDSATTVTLTKPIPRKPEPAATLLTVSTAPDKDAQAIVETVYQAAKTISSQHLPYVWGGGHATAGMPDQGTSGSGAAGYDCSGSVAAALLAGGILPDGWKNGVPVSGEFASSWGDPGQGREMTVWANAQHVWIEFDLKAGYRRFDTSPHGDGPTGPQVRTAKRPTDGFTPRHWKGT